MRHRRYFLMTLILTVAVSAGILLPVDSWATGPTCARTIKADVVVFDTPILFNRLGAQNVNWITYALRRDVIAVDSEGKWTGAPPGTNLAPGFVAMRPDKRIRPLVLRAAAGDCLEVTFQNLLAENANPFNADPPALNINDQVTGRFAGFHPQGLQLVSVNGQPGIASDSSWVGVNASSLADVGQTKTYKFYAEKEGTFLAQSYGATFGGEATAGNLGVGMFAAVNVQPSAKNPATAGFTRFYRSQVTEEELRLATSGSTAKGQPIINYEARYPYDCPDGVWCKEGKAGLPILNMLDGTKIVHSDINAMIVGPNYDGTFHASTYPLENTGKRNPTVPNRLEPFREFTVIFHDENAVAQAFPHWFEDPVLSHTLHGVRDTFMMNYGSAGIGSEIIANRLGVGPMHDCLTCAYEEFFLTSFTVGDPAMLVNIPANVGLELCGPGDNDGNLADPTLKNCDATGPKATKALYPDDPSNVHHSYTGDFTKFRNLHSGKEQHIFHLHNHQWLFNANDDNANYLDAQGIGPGSGYTYEINFGGSGNRNKSAGDAIFHCHFYPHFAQGMWELWRHHDVFETGTRLEVTGDPVAGSAFHTVPFALFDGTPAEHPAGVGIPAGARMRALPDGEILVGTPIPAVVPLPGKPMPVMPGKVVIVAKNSDGLGDPDSSQAHVVDRTKNPGFPFWIAGVDCGGDTATCPQGIVGQRPTTPPLDMLSTAGGWDGGLPRNSLDGYLAGGASFNTQNRLDFSKVVLKAKPVFFPETGTDLELVAMAFHGENPPGSTTSPVHIDTFFPDGSPATGTGGFRVNGAKPAPGSPFFEPCIDDEGRRLGENVTGKFFDGAGGTTTSGSSPFHADNPRIYKAANVQVDAVFNKVGYHYPQQRIIALWDDVVPTINKEKAPQPFVIRNNTFDCTRYLHTNLVPEIYELDDYQVRTPTDIIGQHIHLPKWDLTSSDGSGNGWNYEDGTLSPGAVRERIRAINEYNHLMDTGDPDLVAKEHPFFKEFDQGKCPDGPWCGARTTLQHWFFDPVVNVAGVDRGLGIIFTHDHFGPSTHQQVGLYATVLTEPAGSRWVHAETGAELGTQNPADPDGPRDDGGPTAWQAAILGGDYNLDGVNDGEDKVSYREYFLQFGDFQHAYEAGVYVGANQRGEPFHTATADGIVPNPNTFRSAINPPFRQQASQVFPDIQEFPAFCPKVIDGVQIKDIPRPCPEAISADDVGMLVVNYRNEPIALRVFDPFALGPDFKPGTQAAGPAGDLAFALQSRTDRAIPFLNVQPPAGSDIDGTRFPPPVNTGILEPGDPFTPVFRTYSGDTVRVKIQAGATEHEHNASIHGTKWLQGGSGHGASPNSGWRNSQNAGISEQFTFNAGVTADLLQLATAADYAWAVDSSQDGWWSGVWGLIRNYRFPQADLFQLPSNPRPITGKTVENVASFNLANGVCPKTAPVRQYHVTALLANDFLLNPGVNVLPIEDPDQSAVMNVGAKNGGFSALNPDGGTLVYNPRDTLLDNGKSGPLHDPTAIVYVETDIYLEPANPGNRNCARGGARNTRCPVKLKAGAPPLKPLVLRAAAGDCIRTTVINRLPAEVPDLAGYNTLLQVAIRNRGRNNTLDGVTTFQNNLIRPSSYVGLHPQLVEYDVTKADGTRVGTNPANGIIPPGASYTYSWYAGDIQAVPGTTPDKVRLVANPVEFGGSNLIPADKIKQGQKGLVGAMIIEPKGSSWTEDAQNRASATVTAPGQPAFRDFAVVIQKGQNLRFKDGTAIENIAAEGQGIPEDSHDAGQKGINYGTEPMWFRFGFAPDAPFGRATGAGLADAPNPEQAYSNTLPGVGGDPVTPVFTVARNQPFRMRVLEPTGVGRGTTFNLHGHLWQRAPYVSGAVPSQTIGDNWLGMYLGHQESVTPAAHFDIVPKNGGGGAFGITGDYLFRDQGSFGNTDGIWGILRVQ